MNSNLLGLASLTLTAVAVGGLAGVLWAVLFLGVACGFLAYVAWTYERDTAVVADGDELDVIIDEVEALRAA